MRALVTASFGNGSAVTTEFLFVRLFLWRETGMRVVVDGCKVGIEVMDSGNRDRELSAFAEFVGQTAEVVLPDYTEDEERGAVLDVRPVCLDLSGLDLRLASYTDDLVLLRHTDETVTVNIGIFRRNAGRILRILGCEHPGQAGGE